MLDQLNEQLLEEAQDGLRSRLSGRHLWNVSLQSMVTRTVLKTPPPPPTAYEKV